MEFKLIWNNNNVIIECSGDFTTPDFIFANNLLIGDIRFDKMKYQIWDFRKVNEVLMDEGTLEVVKALDKSSMVWNSNLKVALVAEEDYHKEILETFISMLDSLSWPTKLFDNMDNALKWCKEQK